MLDAPFLLLVFDVAVTLALGAWLGALAFFTFGLVPIIFKALDRENSRSFVRAIFPIYYNWGVGCTTIALPALVGRALSFPEFRGPWLGIQAALLLGCLLAQLYCGQALTPAINAAPEGEPRWKKLHARSVVINGLVLLVALGLSIGFALRPKPRTAGIDEYTPEERARYDVEYLLQLTTPKKKAAQQSEGVSAPKETPKPEEAGRP
jgi:hypothetical protein